MLAGRPVFHRHTLADTLAAVLTSDPDWTALPPHTPIGLRWLLQRCLDKDPKRRLRDIADARFELEPPGPADLTPVSPKKSPRASVALVGVATLALVLFGGAGGWLMKPSADPRAFAFPTTLPKGQSSRGTGDARSTSRGMVRRSRTSPTIASTSARSARSRRRPFRAANWIRPTSRFLRTVNRSRFSPGKGGRRSGRFLSREARRR